MNLPSQLGQSQIFFADPAGCTADQKKNNYGGKELMAVVEGEEGARRSVPARWLAGCTDLDSSSPRRIK